MKKIIAIILALFFVMPFVFVDTKAKKTSASKFYSEINYIQVEDLNEANALDYVDEVGQYPYTATNGDLLVYAAGTTTGKYKCIVYNNGWNAGSTVEKTLDELVAAHKAGTHVAVYGIVAHAHGLDTATTEDDVYYDKVMTADCTSLNGKYFLSEDITLENDITVGANADICLCGHVININAKHIENASGVLTITDCKDTIHKFTKDVNNLYSLDENNGTEVFKGGVITGEIYLTEKENQRTYFINNSNGLTIENINFVGLYVNSDDTDDSGDAAIIRNVNCSEDVIINNVKFVGNRFVTSLNASCIYFDYCEGDCTIKNTEIKDNSASINKAAIYLHESDLYLDNVNITNNKFAEGGLFIKDARCELANTVKINGNFNLAGKNRNVILGPEAYFRYDGLSNDSKIGLNTQDFITEGNGVVTFKFHDFEETFDWKKIFTSDNDAYFLVALQEEVNSGIKGFVKGTKVNEYYELFIVNRIKQQPTTENQNTFVLEPYGLLGRTVSYQWMNCEKTEIVEKTSGTQNFVDKSFLFNKTVQIDSKFENGVWKPVDPTGQILGVTVNLSKGDIVRIDSEEDSIVALAVAPDYTYDTNYLKIGTTNYFIVPEDGKYAVIVSRDSCACTISVIKPTAAVSGQTTNQLTTTKPGLYECFATVKETGKDDVTVISNIVEIEGFAVNFKFKDNEAYISPYEYVENGAKINAPANPIGMKVLGWYTDLSFITQWDFDNDTVTKDTTLYAVYEPDINIQGSAKFVVSHASEDCIVTVGEGLDLSLDNFKSFTFDGVTYNKTDLTLIDDQDPTKGYTNGTITIENGCIKITLPKSYLNTFEIGNKEISVELTGSLNGKSVEGQVLTTEIKVTPQVVGTAVETSNSMVKLFALAGLTLCAIYVGKKKNDELN